MIRVFKFGGASLKDADALKNALEILRDNIGKGPLILVVSAMGKMTNAFEELHKNWFAKQDTSGILDKIKDFHLKMIDSLFEKQHHVFHDVNGLFEEISDIVQKTEHGDFDRSYDSLIPYGEILSSCITAHYVKAKGLNTKLIYAFDHVFGDNLWREARIQWNETVAEIRKIIIPEINENPDKILITQGFVARSSEGQMITLGREGSDFTASVYAYALDAENVTIWKDVPGLFNADPKSFSNVKLIPHLSYHEAVELAYYGQSIIHPKTIKPLQNKNIPLHIKSFVNPMLPGSIIDSDTSYDTDVPCFILKKNQMLISVSPKDFAFINEHNLGEIIAQLAEIRIRMNVMQNSAISFSFCSDFSNFRLSELVHRLQNKYFLKYNTNLELITIRNYNDSIIEELTGKRKIYLEQRSRTTLQLVAGIVE
jgi:aspartate kinase